MVANFRCKWGVVSFALFKRVIRELGRINLLPESIPSASKFVCEKQSHFSRFNETKQLGEQPSL